MYAKAFFGRVGSFMPVLHTMTILGSLGYFLEYDHLIREFLCFFSPDASPNTKRDSLTLYLFCAGFEGDREDMLPLPMWFRTVIA
jgi:hypothetical protein